jgi:hypothetical protein
VATALYRSCTVTAPNASELDALDDLLRARAQTVGEFVGAECFALFTGQDIDGCDVWARCKVEEIAEPQTVAEVIG